MTAYGYTGHWCIVRDACLLLLHLLTEEWWGWVDPGGQLHTEMVYSPTDSKSLAHPSTNQTWCRATTN